MIRHGVHMTAEDVYKWANWLLLVSLVVGVIATYAIVQSGKLRDSQAKIDLADAKAATAKANERAAQLEKETALVKLQTERLKQATAWRRLTKTQYLDLVERLKGKIWGKVWVEVVDTDPEAVNFHRDIWEALKAAGVDVHWFSGWERALGLQLTNSSSPDGKLLKEAFSSVGISLEDRSEPGLKSAGADVEIIVGSRPPILFTNRSGH
jgi:hypothetical protein